MLLKAPLSSGRQTERQKGGGDQCERQEVRERQEVEERLSAQRQEVGERLSADERLNG